MQGAYLGRLNVYQKSYGTSEILLWRLFTEQSNEWQRAEIPIHSNNAFKVCNVLRIFRLGSGIVNLRKKDTRICYYYNIRISLSPRIIANNLVYLSSLGNVYVLAIPNEDNIRRISSY